MNPLTLTSAEWMKLKRAEIADRAVKAGSVTNGLPYVLVDRMTLTCSTYTWVAVVLVPCDVPLDSCADEHLLAQSLTARRYFEGLGFPALRARYIPGGDL